MKKILLVFLFLLFPGSVLAHGEITNYYIDATVLNDGDVSVKELIVVEGGSDTFKYLLNSHNTFNYIYDDSVDSYIESDIYNSINVVLRRVKTIDIDDNVNFNYIYHDGKNLNHVIDETNDNKKNGEYTTNRVKDGINVTIYNSKDKKAKGYYFEYTIEKIAVLHNDIAEINFDILGSSHSKISNLEIAIHVPNNLETLKKWVHAPSTGHIVLTDDDEVRIFTDELNRKQDMRVRLVFDKDVISNSTKITNKDALDKIIEAESKLEDAEREAIRMDNLRDQIFKLGLESLGAIWLLGMIFSFLKVYFKHDREYASKFNGKYYEKLPDDYSPAMVGYLLNMNITDDDLASSMLFLINNGTIKLKKNDDDLILSLNKGKGISETDHKLIELIFSGEQDVNLSHIKVRASAENTKFLKKYNNWYVFSILEAEKQKLFESTNTIKIKMIIYSCIGLLLALISLFFNVDMFILYTLLITSLIGIIYFKTFRKRTKKGNNKYSKWVAFKRYLEDYEKFVNKEDISLLEQYLIYATTFGCNKKIYEIMKKTANKEELDKLKIYDNIIDEIKSAILNAHSNQA
ncbi:MAG: DUF2207 family protein [Ignavibacteriales bacterium]